MQMPKIQKLTTLSLKTVAIFTLGVFLLITPSITLAATATDDPCNNTNSSDTLKKCVQNNQIIKDLQLIVNVLSAGVGIVVIGMIILGGIQYSIAGDNPQATATAKQRITNALIALLAFLFIFAFLQWLIPGGLFG